MSKPLYLIIGVVAGGILGYLYYRFIGCSTGVCPLTSKPVPAILYGAFMGALIGGR
jgi:hypothetical protein